MKNLLISIAWIIPMLVIVYAILNPAKGLIWQNPTAAFGVALIGMGMMKHGLDRVNQIKTAAAQTAKVDAP